VRTIQITVNGRAEKIEDGLSVAAFLERRRAPQPVVVELNGAVLTGEERQQRILRDGDRLEVIRFVRGG